MHVVLSSLIVAFGLLIPLAMKWQIGLGRAAIGAVFIGSLTGALLSWDALSGEPEWILLLTMEIGLIGILAAAAAAFFFFRDPERKAPSRDGVVVSPADGKVVYVKRITAGQTPVASKGKRHLKLDELVAAGAVPGDGWLIGIGMNLLNVHVNRAPIGGRITTLRPVRGRFMSLKAAEAVSENERFITVMAGERINVGVVQIASRLVRRIVTYLEEDQRVQIGARIGMIKFGSQVDLAIPQTEGLKLTVRPGQEVVAGETVLAELAPVVARMNEGGRQ